MVATRSSGMRRSSLAVLAIATLALGACQTTGGGFNIAGDDVCAAERSGLKAHQDYFYQSMVQGAVAGAVAGGLAGALISGDATGALIGAGAGAVVGGIGGYYLSKQKATTDRNVLTQSVYSDISTENSQIDGVTASFRRLRDCRFNTAAAVKNDFAAGKITREDAQAKLAKTQALFREDVQFAESLGGKINERGAEYQNASSEMIKLDPNAQQTFAAREAAARAAAAPAPVAAPAVRYVANEAARVRSQPTTTASQIGTIAPDEAVTLAPGETAGGEWTRVQLADGRMGYTATRLLRKEGTAAPTPAPAQRVASAAPPPTDVAGVAQLTETNQLKRKALNDDVAQAKLASSSAFELDGKISRVPGADDARWQTI